MVLDMAYSKFKLFVWNNKQRMKIEGEKFWKTERWMIWYQDDKQLYQKIYQKKGK